MSELFEGFNMVPAYIYDVLVITKELYKDHLKALYRVLQRLREVVLKLNVENPFSDKQKRNILVSGKQ